jgi:hypothetical protein
MAYIKEKRILQIASQARKGPGKHLKEMMTKMKRWKEAQKRRRPLRRQGRTKELKGYVCAAFMCMTINKTLGRM